MKQKHKKAELGYTVPEDYFKESKKRMTVNTLLKANKSNRGQRFLWVGIAASMLLLIGLFEMEKTTSTQFDFEAIIIDSLVEDDATFDDLFEEQYILAEY